MTDTMLKRLALALYNKAASLGLDVDPEGCGDLTPSSVLVMAVLEAMETPSEEMKNRVREGGGVGALAFALAAWPDMLDAIKEGK